jgi:transposase
MALLNELDQIANEMGHLSNSIPRYRMQYNYIELVWAELKREVSQLNSAFRLFDVERFIYLWFT